MYPTTRPFRTSCAGVAAKPGAPPRPVAREVRDPPFAAGAALDGVDEVVGGSMRACAVEGLRVWGMATVVTPTAVTSASAIAAVRVRRGQGLRILVTLHRAPASPGAFS